MAQYTANDLRKIHQASDLLNDARTEIMRTLSMLLGVVDGSEVVKQFGKFKQVITVPLARRQYEDSGALIFTTHKSGLSIALVSADVDMHLGGHGYENLSLRVGGIPRRYVFMVKRTLPYVLTLLAELFPSVEAFASEMICHAEREIESR